MVLWEVPHLPLESPLCLSSWDVEGQGTLELESGYAVLPLPCSPINCSMAVSPTGHPVPRVTRANLNSWQNWGVG